MYTYNIYIYICMYIYTYITQYIYVHMCTSNIIQFETDVNTTGENLLT